MKFTVARLGALLFAVLVPGLACATLTVTPVTWNVVGLDSNNPATGPKFFPVGARVCSNVATTNVTATWNWDTANPNINLRAGSLSSILIPAIAAGACVDAYFEVEVNQIAAAFDTTRRYHIVGADGSGSVSSPTPREIYVEHLISQNRNSVTGAKLNGVPIPAGGSVALVLGNTYTIELDSGTATQGYNQLESFINFSNAIFRIQSVTSAYSANNSPYVSGPAPATSDKLYADACLWDNNPASPNYRSCVGGDFKSGGTTITTTYVVKIIGGGGTSQTLSALLYDFSGSSYHYNSDFSLNSWITNIVDPTSLTFAKAFAPAPAVAGGTSTLTFTIGNPNAAAISGANFSDTLPLLAGNQMVVASPASFSTSGCGAATFAPVAGASSISFANGTVAANSSCSVSVLVAVPALPTSGTYANVSANLFVGVADTGHNASANLALVTVGPPTSSCGLTLAQWTMPPAAGTGVPPAFSSKAADVAAATAAAGAGIVTDIDTTIGNPINAWAGHGFGTGASLNTGNNGYFEFSATTTNYNTLTFTFDARIDAGLNGPASMQMYSSTDGVTFTPYGSAMSTTAAFVNYGPAFTGTANTNGLTYFRIYGYNAANNGVNAELFVDNVTVGGCQTTPPPTITKSFLTNPVAVGGSSTLQFTLTNPGSTTATGVKFMDSLPAGTQASGAPSPTTTCGGSPTWAPAAGATTLNFGQVTGATLAGGASCTASVNVIATTAGPHTNVSGFVSSTEGGTNTTATGSAVATLTALQPPSVTKTFNTSPIIVGATALLTVTIQNPNSGNALSGVAIGDTYPAGLLNANPLVPAVTNTCGGAVTAAAGGNGLSLSGGSIVAGGSCAITVPVTSASAATYINVTGAVSAAVAGSGNTASATLVVNAPNPAISLAKRVSTSAAGPWTLFLTVSPGTPLFYQFTAENTGDVPLNPFSVSDPTLAGTGADPASCVWQTTNLPTTLPTLPVASATIDPTATCVKGPVTAVLGAVTNTATAHGTFAGLPHNSSPATATYIGALPGFNLVKQAGTSATGPWASAIGVAAGGNVFYKFTIVNTGALDLSAIGVTDPLVSTASCTFTDPLLVGQATTCVVGPVVATGVNGSTTPNTATAHGTNGGVFTTPPSTASYTISTTTADVAIAKTDGVSSVNAGGSTTYTLTVINNGPADVTGATVVDSAPPGLTFGAWTCAVTNAGSGGVVTTACGAASGSGNLNTTVTMKPGAIITYTVPATVAAGASGNLVNSATVTAPAGVFDPTPANNTATDSDAVIVAAAVADLAITKTNGAGSVNAGGSTVYTITVTNNGPAEVTGATVTDLAPIGLTINTWTCVVSNAGSGGVVTTACGSPSGSGNINATVTMKVGAVITFTVPATVAANATGTIVNIATVNLPAGVTDPTPGNNSASNSVAVAGGPPIAVAPIPTLGPLELALLMLLLGAMSARFIRTRRMSRDW